MGYNERLGYCYEQMSRFGYYQSEVEAAARRMMLTGLLVYPDVDYEPTTESESCEDS